MGMNLISGFILDQILNTYKVVHRLDVVSKCILSFCTKLHTAFQFYDNVIKFIYSYPLHTPSLGSLYGSQFSSVKLEETTKGYLNCSLLK